LIPRRAGRRTILAAPAARILAAAATLILLALAQKAQGAEQPAAERPDTCAACHQAVGGPMAKPLEDRKADVHAAKGISCADCHGGDPSRMDMDSMKVKGFVGRPDRRDVPRLCARCHSDGAFMRRFNPALRTDQLAQYQTSVHGKRLAGGDRKVAVCTDCHGVHSILPASHVPSRVNPVRVAETCGRCHADAEYMKGYKIPTDQFALYRESVHGELLLKRQDLAAPTCNKCHGNHGAFPPDVTSIAGVCGQCHVINKDLFLQSKHHAAFDRMGLPECATCHSNHKILRTSDDMVGISEKAVCIRCHAPGTAGYRAAEQMGKMIAELSQAIQRGGAKLAEAERAGMEVSDAKYEFQNARVALIKARNEVHIFSPERLNKVTGPGIEIAEKGYRAGQEALDELGSRKRWSLIPLAAIVALMVGLVLQIRRIEGRRG
jgi:predicted CXXCH cytochrome family protein